MQCLVIGYGRRGEAFGLRSELMGMLEMAANPIHHNFRANASPLQLTHPAAAIASARNHERGTSYHVYAVQRPYP